MRAVRRSATALMLLALAATSTATARPAASAALLRPPSLRPAAGWRTTSTGPMDTAQGAPELKAASDHGVSPAVLFNFFVGLRHLSRSGIVIWASTSGRGGATPVFTRSRWPVSLSSFRVDHGWEGQPAANVQQRLRGIVVRGWHLDVRVYFGTQHPSKRLLAKAQAELDRLRLPR